VGNGAALIIMSDIAAGLPGSLADLLILYGAISSPQFIALVGLMLSVAAGVVFVEGARPRLLVQYTGRQAGDGLFRGDTPYLALKFNGSGVIAPIYASSLLKLLITFAGFSAAESGCRPDWLCIIVSLLGREQPLYFLLDVALIMFFTFFCTPIVVNPQQMADDLRRHGGFVPGIRPGAETGGIHRPCANAHHRDWRNVPGRRVGAAGAALPRHAVRFQRKRAADRRHRHARTPGMHKDVVAPPAFDVADAP